MTIIESDVRLAERLATEAGEILLALQKSSGLTGKDLGKAGDEQANTFLMRMLRAARPVTGQVQQRARPGRQPGQQLRAGHLVVEAPVRRVAVRHRCRRRGRRRRGRTGGAHAGRPTLPR